jgi:hypothetical protein
MFGKIKAYDSSNAQYVSNSSDSTSCDSVEEQDVEYGRKDDLMFRGYNQCSNGSMYYGSYDEMSVVKSNNNNKVINHTLN